MNQMISGSVWLAIIGLAMLLLLAIGFVKKPNITGKSNQRKGKGKAKIKTTKADKPKFQSKAGSFSGKPSQDMLSLQKRITKHFPDFSATARESHLILERNAKKVAMLTIDTNADLGRRRLGEVAVINFHSMPSVEELRVELSGV
ncbi:hypothetical protein [Psychrobacter sp. FDAARGOS_221]|uniref:hypothetical protein n=1 Tax=Psychrobacter sp. FDAARGOS_221 TaxID=1975705 RepID=UPI000BB5740E|nr:hypothetical protein [Psychrobacter sp. FDAARGOS_221]PNK60154.1 hypothetical protein A6J60_004230 [Psychrobacter sp. FDAARGOS_221]